MWIADQIKHQETWWYLLVVDTSIATQGWKVDDEPSAQRPVCTSLDVSSLTVLHFSWWKPTLHLECPQSWYRYNLDAQMSLDLIPLIHSELSGTWRFLQPLRTDCIISPWYLCLEVSSAAWEGGEPGSGLRTLHRYGTVWKSRRCLHRTWANKTDGVILLVSNHG